MTRMSALPVTSIRVPEPPAPELLGLPANYRQQPGNFSFDPVRPRGGQWKHSYWHDERADMSGRYQWHVYDWAASILKARPGLSVLDVGCGTGRKLKALLAPLTDDIEGIDQASALVRFRAEGPAGARLREANLDEPPRAWRQFDLIICADVLEHLADPRPALRMIRASCHPRSVVLLSTPDRDRLRGRDCRECAKPEHVREWAAGEFRRFVRGSGFRVLRRRFVTQTDASLAETEAAELAWRRGEAPTSPWACCALLCRLA